ncbi:MAG: plastocyanin/azurin family copper-binding protein [Alphaproteobacteria bacterium]|nr:plastocyanin/azurin family copper-binding protein [Alphaproteobacteria bacterium]
MIKSHAPLAAKSQGQWTRRSLLVMSAKLVGAVSVLSITGCTPTTRPVFGPAPGFAGPPGSPVFGLPGSSAALTVGMTDDLQFVPQAARIRVGQTVVWRNVSRAVHTVTFDPRLARDQSSVLLPPGVQPFTTGEVRPGQTVSYRFTQPGNYRYFCIPHQVVNMRGALTVVA